MDGKREHEKFEARRLQHAQDLLQNTYQKSVAARFEGDRDFSVYLEKYIASQNAELDAKKMTETLLQVNHDYGYDPVFILAVIQTESVFNPAVVGSHGEIGLMQIKPSTAAWMCEKKKIRWLGVKKLKDPSYNIVVGAHYFHYLQQKLKSKNSRYINAYNMGMYNLQRLPAAEQKNQAYSAKVISNYLKIYSELQKFKETPLFSLESFGAKGSI